MVNYTPVMTVEEFDRFALLPANVQRRLEFHDGRIIELVSNNKASRIAARILSRVDLFVSSRGLGWTTGADGGYIVNGNRYIPDAAFVSKARQAEPPDVAYNPIAPTLAVEVISPSDDRSELDEKVANYLAAGTHVWVADPETQQIEVNTPGQPKVILTIDDSLDGGTILPDFMLPLKDIFGL